MASMLKRRLIFRSLCAEGKTVQREVLVSTGVTSANLVNARGPRKCEQRLTNSGLA